MKSGKILFFGILLILAVNLVFAADVAYVVENNNKIDFVHLIALGNSGLEADIITDDMIKTTDFSMYHFIFIGDGNLRNAKYIPDMPMILTNSKHAGHFGFLKGGRTKSLGANSNLMVNVMGGFIDVYDSPSVKLGGRALTFNYLPQKFMSEGLVNHASTATNEKNKMGSVVAFNEAKKSCFFGISETKFWNYNSWSLFDECLKFVSGVHDVRINDDTVNSVNGLRIKDTVSNQYLLSEISELKCGMEYKVDYVTENIGNFVEDVHFFAELGDFNWTSTKTGLAVGATTTTGSKTFMITNTLFNNQTYVLQVTAEIDNDENPSDNLRMREVIVSGC